MVYALMKNTTTAMIVFCLVLLKGPASAQEFFQLPGVIHVQTSFDDSGLYSIDQLVAVAKEKGMEFIVPTDHDLQVMEYGVFPFRNLIKKREERNSVIKLGPEKYLAEINRANQKQNEVLVIPGVQSSPFYYWTGSPFSGDLTAHEFRKEFLLIGMRTSEDYLSLPILHRGFSTHYTKELLLQSFVFLAALVLSVYLVIQKGTLRILGCIVGFFSLALLINHHPFQSSLFDPYHGDQGIKPFQELIDYVNERKGLVFWAHPESNYAVNGVQLGPVKLMTKHYPEDLIASTGYTGFEAIYGDNITATDPGKQWDHVLKAYCQGDRSSPVWGISGADFRGQKNDDAFGTYQTILLVKNKSTDDVLEALSSGRFYAIRKGNGSRLSIDHFKVKDKDTDSLAIMGGEIDIKKFPVLTFKLSATDGDHYNINVVVVRGGEVIKSFHGETPLSFCFVDKDQWTGKTFYRLEVRGSSVGRLFSNPIFAVKK